MYEVQVGVISRRVSSGAAEGVSAGGVAYVWGYLYVLKVEVGEELGLEVLGRFPSARVDV